ncbi:MAG: polyprenyl diphosphate synthase [Christensenellales bacterium]
MKIEKVPVHVGFIIDGNGRWAKRRFLPRKMGHNAGVKAVKKTINACAQNGIKFCSFFVFSTENFKRSQEEIDNIFDLLRSYIESDLQEFNEKNIKLIVSGDLTKLPFDLQKSLKKCTETTKNNTKMVVNMCLNYGGRQEIVLACNKALKMGLKSVDEQTFKGLLYSNELPELDLVIRTSGEQRVSNFMLYDLAYAELYFTKTLWPDFGKKSLLKALKNFSKRERRFGKA